MPDFLTTAREIVGDQQAARRAGTSLFGWSGAEVESVEAVASRLEQITADVEAHLASARGQFHAAAFAIFNAGHGGELLAISGRDSFTPEDRALAARLIAELGPLADDAAEALAAI